MVQNSGTQQLGQKLITPAHNETEHQLRRITSSCQNQRMLLYLKKQNAQWRSSEEFYIDLLNNVMCINVSEWDPSHSKCSVIINYDHHRSFLLLLMELVRNGRADSKCIHTKLRVQFVSFGTCYLKLHVVGY